MRFFAILFLLLTSFVSAQEQLMRRVYDTPTDTHIEVTSLFSKPSAGGYLPIRVKVANNQKVNHSVRLSFKGNGYYRGGSTTASEFTISAPQEKVTTKDLLIPINPVANSYQMYANLEVQLSGTMGSQTYSINAEYNTDQPSVLLSEPLYRVNASTIDSIISTSSSGGFSGRDFVSKFTASMMPDNWLAFSGYDSVVMLDSDWTSMPAGSRNAIVSWLRMGGHLIIYSTDTPTKASLSIPEDTSFGKVTISKIEHSSILEAQALVDELTTRDTLKSRAYAMRDDFGSGWPLFKEFPKKEFRYLLFVLVLIIFGILVGPVNLFVFAKSGRRHLLFITTPIISLAASLLLIALILFQDGFGGNGQRITLMEVPSGNDDNAAYLLQEQVSRTGVLTKSSFRIDTPTLLSPTPMEENRWTRFNNRQTDGNYNIQPDGSGLTASGDWFQSRSMQGQILTAVVPTRGRIERAGNHEMVSTFDFPLEKLFYLDDQGKWFRADKIVTGKNFQLTPVDQSIAFKEIDPHGHQLSRRSWMLFDRALERKNHFIAVTHAAPAIGTHPGIRWNKTTTIITGGIAIP